MMQRWDPLGTLADRAAHSLDRSRPHIADRENAGHGSFQRRGQIAGGLLALRTGHYEAAAIDQNPTPLQPLSGGISADKQEQVSDIHAVFLARQAAAQPQAIERTFL